uniref:Uncharacterized protein n=1 Tax=Aplanochytrium stocchinoi TaxID=215587 RepID=A0A7S3PM80_9STRA|mmetsp:Transcript_1945/g.2506  ORF Transcript_1945/g.2506 Transcript_1945/m.2506 type:complete len:354 (+) Transcript_1945:41-1102(+)
MPCLQFGIAPTCGWNGKCVTPGENGSSFCECDSGFSQTLEFNYFVEEEALDTSICVYNQGLVLTLYGLVLIVAGFATILILITKSSRNDVYGHRFTLLSYASAIAGSIQRLMNPDEAIFGIDVPFTILMAGAVVFNRIYNYNFLVTQLDYFSKKFSSPVYYNDKVVMRINRMKSFLFWLVIIEFVTTLVFFIGSALTPRRQIGLYFIRLFCGFTTISFTCRGMVFLYSINELNRDMQAIIRFAKTEQLVTTDQALTMVKVAQYMQPRLYRIKKSAIISSLILIPLFVGAIFSDFWMLCWTYIIPVYGLLAYTNKLIRFTISTRWGTASSPAQTSKNTKTQQLEDQKVTLTPTV